MTREYVMTNWYRDMKDAQRVMVWSVSSILVLVGGLGLPIVLVLLYCKLGQE